MLDLYFEYAYTDISNIKGTQSRCGGKSWKLKLLRQMIKMW